MKENLSLSFEKLRRRNFTTSVKSDSINKPKIRRENSSVNKKTYQLPLRSKIYRMGTLRCDKWVLDGVTLLTDGENKFCRRPSRKIEQKAKKCKMTRVGFEPTTSRLPILPGRSIPVVLVNPPQRVNLKSRF